MEKTTFTKTDYERLALIYCRVSSKRQEKEGHGLTSQEHRCRKYAEVHGHVVEAVFQDSYSGGGDFMNRPKMKEMLDYIDAHSDTKYVVIFDDLSRFARDTVFHLKLRGAFQIRDVIPRCLNYEFDDSPEGYFAETVLAASNELDRQKNRRQVVQKMKARLEKGYWTFNPPPGLKHIKDPIHGKLLVPIEGKREIIAEAYNGFASGRFVDQIDVQRFLQRKKFYGNKPVHIQRVRDFLSRVIYAGHIEYLPWGITRRHGHHEAIVPIEVFDKVQERLAGKVATRVRKDLNPDFPLRGLVVCPCCNKPLTASWSKGRNKKYALYRYNNKLCENCGKSIRKYTLESEFEKILQKIRPTQSALNLTKAILLKKWNERVKDRNTQSLSFIREVKTTEEKIEAMIQRTTIASDECIIQAYEEQIKRLVEKKNDLQDQIKKIATKVSPEGFETALNTVFDVLKSPYRSWKKGGFGMKRLILKIVFERPLAYNRKSGFETAFLSLPLRVFELSQLDNSQGVEVVGIEPTCE